jgi:hypothetical protein
VRPHPPPRLARPFVQRTGGADGGWPMRPARRALSRNASVNAGTRYGRGSSAGAAHESVLHCGEQGRCLAQPAGAEADRFTIGQHV